MTGSDTGVGKTWVACALAALAVERGLRVRVTKPIETGCDPDPADALALARAARDPRPLGTICPVALRAAISPHAAARLEGVRVDPGVLLCGLDPEADLMIVEAAGGLLTPATDELAMADLAARAGLPLVVVVDDALGAINRALLTIEVARGRGLGVAAVVLDRPRVADPGQAAECHAEAIGSRGAVRVLGPLAHGTTDHSPLVVLLP